MIHPSHRSPVPTRELDGETLRPTYLKWRLSVKKLTTTPFLLAALALGIPASSWATTPTGGSMSGSVAEYNAALVKLSHGDLTVPANMVTYTANTAIPVGSYFYVTLPKGFEFTSAPSLTSTSATMSLISTSGRTAEFVVTGVQVSVNDKIVLGGYRVKGATALETIIPAGDGLPVTMQAIGVDPQPLAYAEFSSDSGIQASMNGNTVTIDTGAPSNSKMFYGPPDTTIAVLGNVMINVETKDMAGIPIMQPDGSPNALTSTDTATFQLPGVAFGGVSVYGSTSATCSSMNWKGKVTSNTLNFQSLPINQEVYLCAKATGSSTIKLIGYPNQETTLGFNTGFVLNTHPDDDFLSSGNVSSGGTVCYAGPPTYTACQPEFYSYFKIAGSE